MLKQIEPTSPLLECPPELKTHIFANLEGTDLAKLRTVCSDLATFIKEVPELEYKIELAMSGMVDGPPDGPPVTERLQNLRKYREAWEAGELPVKTFLLPTPLGTTWLDTAGVYVCSVDRGEFTFVVIWRPASTFTGITEKTWTIAPACLSSPKNQTHFELVIGVDVSQDLVILTKITGNKTEGHVLSLSHNGAPHALAASSVIDITLGAFDGHGHGIVEIEGDLVRWQFNRQSDNGLEVWNWKIGRIVWRHDSEDDHPGLDLSGCHILDSSHILAIDTGSTSLIVYDIAHTDQTPLSTRGRALLQLQLPSTADGIRMTVLEYSQLTRSHSSTDGGHSFHGDPSLAVLELHPLGFESNEGMLPVPGTIVFLVPLTTIHGFLRRICSPLPAPTVHEDPSPTVLTWDTWGLSGARVVQMYRFNHVSMMGSLCAMVNTAFSAAFVVDVRARMRQPDPAGEDIYGAVDLEPGETLAEDYSESLFHSEILFQSNIHTTLPYRLRKTPGPESAESANGLTASLFNDTILWICEVLAEA